MPSAGIYKTYIINGYYHIYNRGNNKQSIFKDKQDYKMFFKFLWSIVRNPHPYNPIKKTDITILCYCLMPTHFHLLLKQTSKSGVTNLMKRIAIQYVMYFNKKHKRTGRLFQSAFKAKLIDNEPYLLHLSRYIHLNPTEIWNKSLHSYPYSSYAIYLGKRKNNLVYKKEILSFFKSAQRLSLKDFLSYQSFVEDYDTKGNTLSYDYLG